MTKSVHFSSRSLYGRLSAMLRQCCGRRSPFCLADVVDFLHYFSALISYIYASQARLAIHVATLLIALVSVAKLYHIMI